MHTPPAHHRTTYPTTAAIRRSRTGRFRPRDGRGAGAAPVRRRHGCGRGAVPGRGGRGAGLVRALGLMGTVGGSRRGPRGIHPRRPPVREAPGVARPDLARRRPGPSATRRGRPRMAVRMWDPDYRWAGASRILRTIKTSRDRRPGRPRSGRADRPRPARRATAGGRATRHCPLVRHQRPRRRLRAHPATRRQLRALPATRRQLRAPPATRRQLRVPPATRRQLRAPPATRRQLRALPGQQGPGLRVRSRQTRRTCRKNSDKPGHESFRIRACTHRSRRL